MPPKPKGQQRTLASLWGSAASKEKAEKKKQDKDKKDDVPPAKPSNSIRGNQGKPINTKTSASKAVPKKGKNANATLTEKVSSYL